MLARLSAFVIWALVAATAVFWGLRLVVRTPPAPAYAVTVGDADTVHGDLARVLGSTPVNAPVAAAAPEGSSRFKLLGIVAPRFAHDNDPGSNGGVRDGVALIAVDGKMPKAYAVGAHLDGDLVLQSVSLRAVSIVGQGAAAIKLELPAPSSAATGTLPGAVVGASPSATPVGMPQPVPQITPQPTLPGIPYAPGGTPANSFQPPQPQRQDGNVPNP
ncbi:MAG: hypothetical protein M3O01_14740 [Pseudomonadota bacterium]|nr:hypothetical protein [Pseudomonadota bacterium]